ncbi:TetR/AcrR family transcriptional regulator [Kitasatospora sp. MMS16-BH015]|uniref:TetR/AcrR family transcriptional regulator n=1 Tax=Kitasatospora sp. MMS16-BH015 TaxID=2018025 RepID=UPI00131A4B5E|nr:TetR/AcrR family transcriptional regulator [Kitasatospora sp. MMS16-BH015]
MGEQTAAPQQQRSREKVARILAATAGLLETTPYEELGTKLIAAEAGVSIGALYRYFADREAILVALLRGWQRSDVEIAERLTADPLPERSRQLIGRLLTAYADRFRTVPGYRWLWYHGPRLPALRAEGEQVDREIAAHLHRALSAGYGYPETEDARRRVRLAVTVGSSLLDQAFKEDPEGDSLTLDDAALMIDRYLFAPTAG